MTATPDLDLAAAIEQGARGIALPVASNRHGQLCPVWDRRAYGPAIESCDCWILANARRDAKIAVEAAAGLIAELDIARHQGAAADVPAGQGEDEKIQGGGG